MVEPVSLISLITTGVAIFGYLTKKGLKKMNSKGIKSDCGVEVSDIIQNSKIEIVNELKEFISTELERIVDKKLELNENKIIVSREPTNV